MAKSKKSKYCIGIFLSTVVATASIFTYGVSAAEINYGNVISINETIQEVPPVHLNNERYLNTDSWYVPLRNVFEALGCEVNYDVGYDKIGLERIIQSFPQYEWREKLVVDNVTSQLYGATTGFNDNMPVIEVKSPKGYSMFCQIGSESYSPFSSGPPPIILNDKTYVSIAFVDRFLVQNTDNPGINVSVYWDDQAHDTYYVGKVTWNDETNSLYIDTSANPVKANYDDTLKSFNLGGKRIMQRKENTKYIFCLVENYSDKEHQSFIAVNKADGKSVKICDIDNEFTHQISIEFDKENTDLISLYRVIPSENFKSESIHYGTYNLSEYQFN